MAERGRLSGKVALVTGAGRGIGRSIAEVFAREGAATVVATRTASHGQAVVDAIAAAGGTATLALTDLADRAAVERLIAETIESHGGLDIMVHNAATIPVARVGAITDEQMDAALGVNLKAAIWLAQASLAPMRARGEGRLLYTSSVTAQRAYPGCAIYSASKAALNGFIRAAALELGPDRITVNGIEPGIIRTDAIDKHKMSDEQIATIARHIPLRRFGTPEEVAEAMLFLATAEASYVTGQLLVVDGGTILPENGAFMS